MLEVGVEGCSEVCPAGKESTRVNSIRSVMAYTPTIHLQFYFLNSNRIVPSKLSDSTVESVCK